MPGWTTIMILVALGSSAQLLMTGILGEYVGRIYEEVKRRPLYVVAKRSTSAANCGPHGGRPRPPCCRGRPRRSRRRSRARPRTACHLLTASSDIRSSTTASDRWSSADWTGPHCTPTSRRARTTWCSTSDAVRAIAHEYLKVRRVSRLRHRHGRDQGREREDHRANVTSTTVAW